MKKKVTDTNVLFDQLFNSPVNTVEQFGNDILDAMTLPDISTEKPTEHVVSPLPESSAFSDPLLKTSKKRRSSSKHIEQEDKVLGECPSKEFDFIINSIKQSDDLSREEKDKIIKQHKATRAKIRNRIHANASKQKVKQYISNLEKENAQLKNEIQRLQTINQILEDNAKRITCITPVPETEDEQIDLDPTFDTFSEKEQDILNIIHETTDIVADTRCSVSPLNSNLDALSL